MSAYDLAIPSQLTAALLPDLTLMAGAMILLLVAVWRRESAEHQVHQRETVNGSPVLCSTIW